MANNNGNGFDLHYDVILTGTDLTSSILSAALARIGKKILHLDTEKHYGKEWHSLKLTEFLIWQLKKPIVLCNSETVPCKTDTSEEFVSMRQRQSLFTNIENDLSLFNDKNSFEKFFSHILNTKCTQNFLDKFYEMFKKLQNVNTFQDGLSIIEEFKDKFPELNRIDNLFNIDLCPRFLISNEKMVDILINSTVTRYIEFKKVSRLLTPIEKPVQECNAKFEIVEVPCTRNDIFMSSIISPIEKRYLMSFLEKCYYLEKNSNWYAQFEQKPFDEFLNSQTLTEKLKNFIINTLLMISEPITTLEALTKINFFIRSFGRFCDRPFLFPLYGSEDLIQAFCRYGAVWSGLYCLGVDLNGFIIDSQANKCHSIVVNNYRVNCDYLITDYPMLHLEPEFNRQTMSRAIILNTKSIKQIDSNEMGDLSFIHLPSKFTSGTSVYCFETDYSSRVCPKHYYLQYFWCNSAKETAKMDLEPVINKLLSLDEKQLPSVQMPVDLQNKIIFSIYFNYHLEIASYTKKPLPINVEIVSTPINELNYHQVIEQAQQIFHRIYPDEEFFPKTESPDNKQFNDEQ